MFVAGRDFFHGGNRQSGTDKGLNVQGENVLLPAPSSAALKRPLNNMPPGKTTPPSINHSNYKDEKDKQWTRKKKGGGGVTDRKTGWKCRQADRQKKNVHTDQRTFSPPPHCNRQQRPTSEIKGRICIFYFLGKLVCWWPANLVCQINWLHLFSSSPFTKTPHSTSRGPIPHYTSWPLSLPHTNATFIGWCGQKFTLIGSKALSQAEQTLKWITSVPPHTFLHGLTLSRTVSGPKDTTNQRLEFPTMLCTDLYQV